MNVAVDGQTVEWVSCIWSYGPCLFVCNKMVALATFLHCRDPFVSNYWESVLMQIRNCYIAVTVTCWNVPFLVDVFWHSGHSLWGSL